MGALMTLGENIMKKDVKIDAVVLAGGKRASRHVFGKNKLFLEIEGTPLLIHVIRALEGVERVRKVRIAGPRQPVEALIHKHAARLQLNKDLAVVEQRENLYQNFWSAFLSTMDGYYEGKEREDPEILEKAVLTLPSDLPLITPMEIDEFLDACPTNDLDYCLGMTEERYLRKFYPEKGKPGLRMAYLCLREGNFCVNNLHLVRPFHIHNREFLDKIYECRYQRKLGNILRMAFEFMRLKGLGARAILLYLKLALFVFFRFIGLQGLAKISKGRATEAEVSSYAGKVSQTRIGIIQTTRGGCAVDVDKEKDFETINRRFREWIKEMESD